MEKDPYIKRGLIELWTAALVWLFAAALSAFAAAHPAWVTEWFKPVSRVLQKLLGNIFSPFPFSVAEALILLVLVSFPVISIRCVVKILQKKLPASAFFALLSRGALTAAAFYFIFIGVWGLNYHALPLPEEWGLVREPREAELLALTAEELLVEVNACAPLVARDERDVMSSVPFSSLRAMAKDGFQALTEEKGISVVPTVPKPVFFSEALSHMGITGIFIPFTGEPNVNRGTETSGIPFTMCHEMAHAAGFAPEDEANFIAVLACRESPYPEFRYSGALAAFSYCARALAGEDYDRYTDLFSRLAPEVQADLAARSAYWKRYEGKVQGVAESVNNSYLLAMSQPEGVKSYGLVVDLLISDYLARFPEE